ncbi:hypothetical protein CLV49_0573 [Labedella gwakjiensis]|uniref:Uncharacterized protein n=2 Tax=Labedella gwakjiensis TaxID=390269 RepID=A0A2P8GSM5_9MICO|nr:hypothetical protein CLV49_0573 [Labedella gwakjiensis]
MHMTLLERPPQRDGTSDSPSASRPATAKPTPTIRRPRLLQRIVVVVLVAIAGWHCAATYLWIAPGTAIREALPDGMLSSYMNPLFDQNWSVFAPDPIDGNYALEVRATVIGDGGREVTEWVDATEAEQSMLAGTLLQARAGIVGHKQAMKYYTAYFDLSEEQRGVIADGYFEGEWVERLRSAVIEVEGESETVWTYLRQEWKATAYATQVARATWGDDVEQVQYRISRSNVVALENRDDPDAVPAPTYIDSGWRGLVDRKNQSDSAFADVFRSLVADQTGNDDE